MKSITVQPSPENHFAPAILSVLHACARCLKRQICQLCIASLACSNMLLPDHHCQLCRQAASPQAGHPYLAFLWSPRRMFSVGTLTRWSFCRYLSLSSQCVAVLCLLYRLSMYSQHRLWLPRAHVQRMAAAVNECIATSTGLHLSANVLCKEAAAVAVTIQTQDCTALTCTLM